MSGWWIIVLVLFGGAFGAAAILLYHSRMPDLDGSASRHTPVTSSTTKRLPVKTIARVAHAALGIVGFGAVLVATNPSHRGLGTAISGLALILGFFVSLWLKALKKQREAE